MMADVTEARIQDQSMGKGAAYWLNPACGWKKMVIPSPASL